MFIEVLKRAHIRAVITQLAHLHLLPGHVHAALVFEHFLILGLELCIDPGTP